MSYASAKGRASPHFAEKNRKPPRPLSDDEKAEIAERARKLKTHMPEVLDCVKKMHEIGLVDGLRCIQSVTVFEGNDHGSNG